MDLTRPPLTDIPGSLRALAARIERGENLPAGGHVVVIVDGKDGEFRVASYGEADSALAAASVASAGVYLAGERLKARP
jgi:hypothetical protein